MATEIKPVVAIEDSLERLDIRLGCVLAAEAEPSAVKPSYRLRIDFGKFGQRTSVARLTRHAAAALVGRQVMAVLNFAPRQVGDVVSEVLVLGVQYPKGDSGEATFVTPAVEAKLGSKLF
jgi:tRNA-binding protein